MTSLIGRAAICGLRSGGVIKVAEIGRRECGWTSGLVAEEGDGMLIAADGGCESEICM